LIIIRNTYKKVVYLTKSLIKNNRKIIEQRVNSLFFLKKFKSISFLISCLFLPFFLIYLFVGSLLFKFVTIPLLIFFVINNIFSEKYQLDYNFEYILLFIFCLLVIKIIKLKSNWLLFAAFMTMFGCFMVFSERKDIILSERYCLWTFSFLVIYNFQKKKI